MKSSKYKDARLVPGLHINYVQVLPDPTDPQLPYLINYAGAVKNARKYLDRGKSAEQQDPKVAYWMDIANKIKRVKKSEVGAFVGIYCIMCEQRGFIDPWRLLSSKPPMSCGCFQNQNRSGGMLHPNSISSLVKAREALARKYGSVGRFKGTKNKARSEHITIDPKTSLPVKSPTLRAWEDLRALQHTLPQDPKWRSFGVFLKDVGVSPYPYPCRVAPLHPERRMDLGNAVWKEGEWDDFEVFRFINN